MGRASSKTVIEEMATAVVEILGGKSDSATSLLVSYAKAKCTVLSSCVIACPLCGIDVEPMITHTCERGPAKARRRLQKAKGAK